MRRIAFGLLLLLPALLAAAEYEIGSGDVVKVAVLGQPDMSGEFAIDADGLLSFPFLGKIKAAGLTTGELERKLTTLLADGYLRKPAVAVTIKDYGSRRVFVTGEVVKPGAYGLRPQASLLALLVEIGELTANAGHEVVIVRPPKAVAGDGAAEVHVPTDDEEPLPSPSPSSPATGLPGEVPGAEILRLSLREVRSGNPDKDFRLEPGDTVYFPKAAQFYVTGSVPRAGAFRYEEGLTVYQAVSLAGGISERGSSKVKIVRIVGGKRREIKAKPTDPVLPEDTLVVPERFF